MSIRRSQESNETATAQVRKDAAATLGAASSTVDPAKTSTSKKIAIAGALIKLARRYPIPALIVGGVALAFFMSRRNGHTPATRH